MGQEVVLKIQKNNNEDDKQSKQNSSSSIIDSIESGAAPESTDTNIRYAGYASRLRTILNAAHRYIAYTSDVGESFRPIAHPRLVTAGYIVSWAYLIGDVSYEGYKAWLAQQEAFSKGKPWQDVVKSSQHIEPKSLNRESLKSITKEAVPEDWRLVVIKRAAFQSVASMALPAFTIHSTVKYSSKFLKNVKNPLIRTWAPIGLGLSVVPILPYLFDKPVEEAVDYIADSFTKKI